MIFPWFKRIGIFYVPVNFLGWMISLSTVCYSIYVFMDIDRRSHSVSDTIINFAFNLFIIGAIYSLISYFTSRSR